MQQLLSAAAASELALSAQKHAAIASFSDPPTAWCVSGRSYMCHSPEWMMCHVVLTSQTVEACAMQVGFD